MTELTPDKILESLNETKKREEPQEYILGALLSEGTIRYVKGGKSRKRRGDLLPIELYVNFVDSKEHAERTTEELTKESNAAINNLRKNGVKIFPENLLFFLCIPI